MRPTRNQTPMRRVPGTPMRAASQDSLNSTGDKVEVEVFCRIRPTNSEDGLSCARLEGSGAVVLTPPETSRAYRGGCEERQYTFTDAFGENSTQKDVFAEVGRPLVKDLIDGSSSLLFMYGVTGSGKTHSIQGTPKDGGIMSRSIDVLFNSIGNNVIEDKGIIIPDGSNGFSFSDPSMVRDNADVMSMEDRLVRERMTSTRLQRSLENLANRTPDDDYIDEIDPKGIYAVFVSYIEVYNENVFDLLQRDPAKKGLKDLRTDSYNQVYVHDSVEIQVTSAQEALETFYRGQKQRREAATALNATSSRSHSIFNIRLVKVAKDAYGNVDVDNNLFVLSQLSLVDMAGSERTNRTGNTGEKLVEASSINNSLTVLRRCIKTLRDNQKRGRRDHIPYRDSKITKMFSNFFDGKPGCGKLRLMVCINPRPADFDENLNVMEFAETAAKIQIERREAAPREFITPGRLKGNEAYREALKRAANDVPKASANATYRPIYSLGPEWPLLELQNYDDEDALDNLDRYLTKRISTRNTLVEDNLSQIEEFRARLVEIEKEVIVLREENNRLKGGSDGERRRIKDLERRLVNAEAANTSLQRNNEALKEAKSVLERELDDQLLQMNENKKESKREIRKLKTQVSQKDNELAHQDVLRQRHEDQKREILNSKAKLRAVRKIATSDDSSRMLNKTVSDPDVLSLDRENQYKRKPLSSAKSNNDVSRTPLPTPRRSVAVSNPRYRRSRSAGQVWVDHQPSVAVPSNTIMQPTNLKKKRSMTKISDKDLVKCSNYALTTHEQDSDGDLETKIFKGEIIPTATGGAQIVFNDVEMLRQKSPEKSPERMMTRRSKRSYEELQAATGSVRTRAAAFDKLGAAKRYRR